MEASNLNKFKVGLDRVRSSRSWRITKPLRASSFVVKKLLEKTGVKKLSPAPSSNVKNNIGKSVAPLDSDKINGLLRMSTLAEAAMLAEDWAAAMSSWQEIINRYGQSTPAGVFVRLSITYRKQGMFDEAKDLMKQATKIHKDYIPLHIEWTEIFMDEGKWPTAIRQWEAAIETFAEKTPADIWVKLARAYRFNNQLSRAESVAKRALLKFPTEKRLLIEQAEIAAAQNKRFIAVRLWANIISSLDTQSPRGDWHKLIDARAYVSVVKRLNNLARYKAAIAKYARERDDLISKSKEPRIAIYTAIVGDYEVEKLPEKFDPRFDYIIFTDLLIADTGIFQIKPLPYFHVDKARSARYVKTHPHILLPGYDVVVWVDGSIMITGDIYPMVKKFLVSKKAVGAIPHPERKSIYEEGEACLELMKDDTVMIRSQLQHYREQRFDCNDLIESGVIMFNAKHNKTSTLLDTWWREIDRYSKRDQLSINYAIHEAGVRWLPLMRKSAGIRNHRCFVIYPHNRSQELMLELRGAITKSMINPMQDDSFAKHGSSILKQYSQQPIDIVLCVHNAYESVKNCLQSIERSRQSLNQKLIIIDDGSKTKTTNLLINFSQEHEWVEYHRNETATGYTRAANKGLKLSKADFTILLNSDTIVTKGWAEKMWHVACSQPHVGIVGPLSSAASHQSIPKHISSKTQTAINPLPKNMTPEDLNRQCEKWSLSTIFPLVPLVHGFCFGVTKELIESIGYFDAEKFPRGYGEENDYCFRAMDAGFNLAVATNTYVFHEKSQSYNDAERINLMKQGSETLNELHSRDRVKRAILSMQSNPLLERMRTKSETLFK